MARYHRQSLLSIFERTDGRCHICRATLAFDEYGANWEVDNRSKQTRSSRSARAMYGNSTERAAGARSCLRPRSSAGHSF